MDGMKAILSSTCKSDLGGVEAAMKTIFVAILARAPELFMYVLQLYCPLPSALSIHYPLTNPH